MSTKNNKIDDSLLNLSQTEKEYILNSSEKQAHLSRWVFSLTKEEVDKIAENLELVSAGAPFDMMMKIHREVLGDYDPNDF